MRNTTEDLKSLYQHAKNMQNMYQQNRPDLAFLPQQLREDILKWEEAIREAARNKSEELEPLIMQFGKGVLKVKDYGGNTPAHLAARHNSESLRILIDAFGESVLRVKDNRGSTVISDAAIYNKESLELLIEEFGEKVLEVKNSKGYTPLQLAAIYNREAFKLLIEKLPKTALSLFTEKNRDGNTALHLAIQDNKGDLLKFVIEKYPEIIESFLSEKNIKGNTPLHFATQYNKDLLELLIEKFGEKVLEVRNNDGETVLRLAAHRNTESLAILIEKFPALIESLLSEKNAVGETTLHIAAWRNKDSLALLIEKFPEIIESLLSAQDKGGHTPLHLSTGNKGAFKLLIEKFPEQVKSLFDVENTFGDTVLQHANSRCPDALPKEYRIKQTSCVILGNKESMPIPGLPEEFSAYYQDQVALLLKLRLEDAVPGALKSLNVLEANYTLRESNEDDIAAKLSSFMLASDKDTILMPINIGGSHLVGIAAVKDGNNVVIHYMDSELGIPPQSLIAKIESMLKSHDSSMELRIAEVERQKYSNCGPEVIENLTAFATGKPRASQEEAILKHSLALERHLLKDSDNIHYTDTNIPFSSNAVFSSPYAMLDEKLVAQIQHYLNTGEAFDTARAAIDDGTVHITRQPFMLYEAVVNTNTLPNINPIYHDGSYNNSLEALPHNAEFSSDINMVAVAGLLSSFLVSSAQTPEFVI